MLTSMAASSSLAQAPAATPAPFAPGVRYSDAVPTLEQVLGHAPGTAITLPDGVVTYLKALAQAAPTRTRLIEYGRTWEGRPLVVLVIASAERMAQLDAVQKGLQRLADPRVLASGEEDRLVASLPVTVWLMHAVHGNEISSVDAALLEAYHLLAAQDDPQVTQILRESLVLIDPLENPDGRARFVASNAQAMGPLPDAEPFAAEHNEPWPGGRANHYLFDMNRDWFAQSQAETRGRTKFFLQWFPQVVVDLHEMSGDSSYYFAPPADPLNPHITPQQIGWFNTIGKANAAKFDERGFAYFNREVYDSFYPGYGESWPIFHGAIGMTYEMASARGLTWRRTDEDLLTYRDGVLRHFTSAITTLATSAANREQLLRDFVAYRRSAISDGEKGRTRAWLVPVGADPARAHRFAQLLRDQGFDVLQSSESITVGTRTLAVGTYVVPAAQPAGRLLQNLLDPSIAQPDAFVKEQDRRRRKRLPDQMYDVTGWHLPSAYDVEVLALDHPVRTQAMAALPPATVPAAKVGYLVPWGLGAARLVVAAQAAGLRVRFAGEGFTVVGRAYPTGTAIIRSAENPADTAATLSRLVTEHRADVVAIDSAFTEAGISLGSNEVVALKAPRVLLAWDAPTSSQSAGWARYVLERRFGQRVTAVRVSAFMQADLTRFDVVVLPSGNYSPALSGAAVQRLKDWVSAGGTLITIAEATRWATRDGVNLLDTTAELRDGRPEASGGGGSGSGSGGGSGAGGGSARPSGGGGGGAAATVPAAAEPKSIDLEKATLPKEEPPVSTSGALMRANVDPEHWLSAGSGRELHVMVEGTRVFSPITLDKGRNVATYATGESAVSAGLMWPEARTQLGNKPALIEQPRGRGHVIAFVEDPNFRAFMEGTELLFINAVLLGPAH
ncbi:Zinc carboxypeptidase [Luteitalea pratensis]|uniref:Zinc carboxypeptidase n=2 Tax=Luteitalea pratensis TaxID=1855912 RepID=A0A143PG66_LUTPR|nr:Zinc carboxypeptidase [Luteitalea pratensis]